MTLISARLPDFSSRPYARSCACALGNKFLQLPLYHCPMGGCTPFPGAFGVGGQTCSCVVVMEQEAVSTQLIPVMLGMGNRMLGGLG